MAVLDISLAALAPRAMLPVDAVQRLLNNPGAAPHVDVAAVGAAVGLNLDGGRSVPVKRFLRRAAVRKAKYLVRLVQGTSALEGQAVDSETERELVRATVRALLADRQKIWQ